MFTIHNNILADHAFYINLPTSVDRHEYAQNQIKTLDINGLDRFEALKDSLHQASATKSHRAVLELADKEGYDTICVLEDDFHIQENLLIYTKQTRIQDYLPVLSEHLKNIEWDIILLGFNGKKPCIPVSQHLSKNFKSTGAWAYLINKKAYQYILNNFSYYNDRLAIDDILPYLTYFGFKSYVTNTCIINHAAGFISTLQPSLGPVDYTQWILGNYHRTIWHSLDGTESDFSDCLNKIYKLGEYSRNNIVLINNFDGNLSRLIEFMQNNFKYSITYTEIKDNYTAPGIGYYLNVESPYLLHGPNNRPSIDGLGSYIVEVSI